MMDKLHLCLMKSKWACLSVLAMALQEIIGATSSIWLVFMMNRITAGEDFSLWLACYVSSLLIPSIPLSLAYIFRTSWKLDAQKIFIENFVKANKDNISEWSDKKSKEKKSSILTSEGSQAIFDFIEYLWDLLSFFLSVLFNIIALAMVVEKLFLLTFSLSIALAALTMQLRRPRQRKLTEKALSSRVELGKSLLSAWDNVLAGNSFCFYNWSRRFHQRVQYNLKRNMELERFDQTMAILISMIVMVPSLSVVVWFAFKHYGDTPKLAAFFVTIPTIFVILRYTYQLLAESFRFNMHKSKLNSIFRAIQPAPTPQIEEAKPSAIPPLVEPTAA